MVFSLEKPEQEWVSDQRKCFIPGFDCCTRREGAVRTSTKQAPAQGQGPGRGLQGETHQICGGYFCKSIYIIIV